MAPKVRVTRTLNPLQFEALEPHRFEDLIRRLLYRFRDWSDIEPTGKKGSDHGFDVRAWERNETVRNMDEDGQEGIKELHGRLWQIQAKREKTLPPAAIRTIVRQDIDEHRPPHGYILAAATNISKTAYDTFREETQKKQVRQSYFWGKDYLEDQLALPENDEILFTFFGISLSHRRSSRIAAIKFGLNNKNKILKLLFPRNESFDMELQDPPEILLRDIKDTNYPDRDESETKRAWEAHTPKWVDARQVMFKRREYYAYLDQAKRRWDYSNFVDLTDRKLDLDEANKRRHSDEGRAMRHFWNHLPQRFKAKVVLYGIVTYDDMLVIDDRGDPTHCGPHIFVDFDDMRGPFSASIDQLTQREFVEHAQKVEAEFEKTSVFPQHLAIPAIGTIHDGDKLGLLFDAANALSFSRALFSFDDKMKSIQENDLIEFASESGSYYAARRFEVTHIYQATVKQYLDEFFGHCDSRLLASFAGREVNENDGMTVYELDQVQRVALPIRVER